jgi:hypothetical protein
MIAKRLLFPGVLLAVLALLMLNLAHSSSGAAAPPDTLNLVGTYQGTMELIRSDYIGKEPLFWNNYPPAAFPVTINIANQEGSLFWGQITTGADGAPLPMDGALIPSGGSSAALCITMSSGSGHGSATLVAAQGDVPAQIIVEMLMTSGGRRYTGDTDIPGEFEHWSAHMYATRQ